MRIIFYFALIILYFIFSFFSFLRGLYPKAAISFLNVGQGDSILISTPYRNTILIDGGGNYEADSFLALGMFFDKCVIKIMILTHEHADHSLGLDRINKRCTVQKLFTANNLRAGDIFTVDDIKFKVFWPPFQYKSPDKNNESLVLLMEYKGFSALLSGDISGEILCRLNLPKIDVYKVSHHGSITGLCDKLKFESAVISVGENTFGHPSPKVLDFLKKVGSKIYRTDIDGTVMILLEHGNFPTNKRKYSESG